jgi:hypothetical protein
MCHIFPIVDKSLWKVLLSYSIVGTHRAMGIGFTMLSSSLAKNTATIDYIRKSPSVIEERKEKIV